MRPLYELLHDVESMRLAVYLLEPEPVEIEALMKNGEARYGKTKNLGDAQGGDIGGKWAEKTGGFKMESNEVTISIGDENNAAKKQTVSIRLKYFCENFKGFSFNNLKQHRANI